MMQYDDRSETFKLRLVINLKSIMMVNNCENIDDEADEAW